LTIEFKNRKMILVTGATGLVGGHLLWHLLQENETLQLSNELRVICNRYERFSAFTRMSRTYI